MRDRGSATRLDLACQKRGGREVLPPEWARALVGASGYHSLASFDKDDGLIPRLSVGRNGRIG